MEIRWILPSTCLRYFNAYEFCFCMKAKSNQSAPSIALNVISEETHLEGNLTSTSDFRIAGRVYGDLDIQGKLLLTSEAVIKGEIRVEQADISGTIRGEVIASEKVVLRGNAKLTGNIFTKVLVIEEGAYFQGECHMTGTMPGKEQEKRWNEGEEQDHSGQPELPSEGD